LCDDHVKFNHDHVNWCEESAKRLKSGSARHDEQIELPASNSTSATT